MFEGRQMPYWDTLNDSEKDVLRKLGIEADGHAVHRVGKDYLVFLHYKSHREFAVAIPEEKGKKHGRENDARAFPI